MPRGIISLTTHAARAAHCAPVVESLVGQAKAAGLEVCLTVQSEAYRLLPHSVKSLPMQFIVEERDIGSNMKYLYAMKRFPDLPIIAVDDDNIFWDGTLAGMMLWHSRLPNCIICRRWREIVWTASGKMVPFTFKSFPLHDCRSLPPGGALHVTNGFPEHCAGVLYPPGCFKIDDSVIAEAEAKAPHDDDVFARILALRNRVETFQIHDPAYLKVQRDKNDPFIKASGLWKNGNGGQRSTQTLLRFEDELRAARSERP